MSNKRLVDLYDESPASALNGTEIVYAVQSNTDVGMTALQIGQYATGSKTRKTTSATIDTSAYHWIFNTDSAGLTATLPAGVDGNAYRIINSGTSGNNLTVTPDGSENLIGKNEDFTLLDGESLLIVYDATDGWY